MGILSLDDRIQVAQPFAHGTRSFRFSDVVENWLVVFIHQYNTALAIFCLRVLQQLGKAARDIAALLASHPQSLLILFQQPVDTFIQLCPVFQPPFGKTQTDDRIPDRPVPVVIETAVAKFDESVDVAINLGIDVRKSDQVVRGSVVLPSGTGKTIRVAVFAQGDKAKEALDAGADVVGFEDLAEQVKAGEINFDLAIASPDAMRIVGQLGQILGPRGLMPNPKVGTVTADVAGAVRNAKAGQIQYRADKAGIVHCTVGRASFGVEALKTNIMALIDALNKSKPVTSKGVYLRKMAISSTMGVGVRVDHTGIN